MDVKIDTKEKFTVITPPETAFAANMTEKFNNLLLPYLQKDIPHIILNMAEVNLIDENAGDYLATIQQQFYEHNCSFVICNLQKPVEKMLDERELLEIMNVTPTESEAWDIVQMEEIERELLGDN
jgi:anti-anti-sigma factor